MGPIVGIDVGGTHADGVLLAGTEVVAKNKVAVDQTNLAATIITLLESLVSGTKEPVTRIHLSTTLCTNAIVRGALDEVGMFIQAGPGMNPSFLECGEHVCFLDGAIDHRGHIIKNPDSSHIDSALETFRQRGLTSIGVVTKFSHRNNEHEQLLYERAKGDFPHISLGHRISGLPNFPRRVYSTWLNSGLKLHFHEFEKAMQDGLRSLKLDCPCYILKADGGTMPFEIAGHIPCESVHSGPSASVLGCLALHSNSKDSILLDIGGTTTDIGILADGVPLLEPYGVTISGRPTLIRALNTRSVGLGGDSRVNYIDGTFQIGPEKDGPPVALGGTIPTPTDALITLGTMQAGNISSAREAMTILCPDQLPEVTAAQLLETFTAKIKEAALQMIEEVFGRPVFTVSALLERKRLQPKEIITVGGPAQAMQKSLEEAFELPCVVPDHFEVANAVGAARTRPTLQATLYADTTDRSLVIPEIGYKEKIDKGYGMQAAEERLIKAITAMAKDFGMTKIPTIDFLERQEMNTISGFRSTGKIISLKAQIQPGLEQL